MEQLGIVERQRVAILGSGRGSNADAILSWAELHESRSFDVVVVISTTASAGIHAIGISHGVATHVLNNNASADEVKDELLMILRQFSADVLVLAGFMRLLSPDIIRFMNGRVLNIHPALLPKHGGKGMFGLHVHKSVIDGGDNITGASVHLVTEFYDEGSILGQEQVPVLPGDTPETLSRRVNQAELLLFPRVLECFTAELLAAIRVNPHD